MGGGEERSEGETIEAGEGGSMRRPTGSCRAGVPAHLKCVSRPPQGKTPPHAPRTAVSCSTSRAHVFVLTPESAACSFD